MLALDLARPGKTLRVLALGAHSDDIEIGAGGAILVATTDTPAAALSLRARGGDGGSQGDSPALGCLDAESDHQQPNVDVGGTHTDLGPFLSSRLRQLFADHAEKLASEVEVTGSIAPAQAATAIDFNPFIDGQNALLLDVAIGTPVVIGDQALVTVAFHNFDQPTLLSLSLVREGDGWKVDDVTSTGGEENWMLSWLLQYDPWGL